MFKTIQGSRNSVGVAVVARAQKRSGPAQFEAGFPATSDAMNQTVLPMSLSYRPVCPNFYSINARHTAPL
jgi:hypothetical protein